MPYICSNPDAWNNKPLVGTGQCVELVKEAAKAPATSFWKEGVKVKGDATIARGTSIATFVNGVYESKKTGNHAALYLEQDANGIWVYDQWATKPEQRVTKRLIRFKAGQGSASNDGDRYSVIE
jgi:hypothetical protein